MPEDEPVAAAHESPPTNPPNWHHPVEYLFTIWNTILTACIFSFYISRYFIEKPYFGTSLDYPEAFAIGINIMMALVFLVVVPLFIALPLAMRHATICLVARRGKWHHLFPLIVFSANVFLALNAYFSWIAFLIPQSWFHFR